MILENGIFILNWFVKLENTGEYSQACEQRSPEGETDFGLYRQVFFFLEDSLLRVIGVWPLLTGWSLLGGGL